MELAAKVVQIGNCSGRDIAKFERFDLTPMRAKCVAPPLIAECFANLECRVVDTRLVNSYNLFLLEVLKAWVTSGYEAAKTIHHRGYGRFVVDGKTLMLQSAMR